MQPQYACSQVNISWQTTSTAASLQADECCRRSTMTHMQAGETPAEAAVRNVKREAGLSLEPKRFNFLCVTSLLWEQRREEPAGLLHWLATLST